MLGLLLDLVAPARCACCGDVGADICAGCGLAIARAPAVERRDIAELALLRAAGPYQGELRAAILAFKYGNRRALGHKLASLAARKFGSLDCEVLVPVPLHSERALQRGYNQAEIIARALSVALGASRATPPVVLSFGLRRIRATPEQSRLHSDARITNVAGAFARGPQARELLGRRVLLVDDVVTTGATLRACARVVASCGAAHVAAACLAATP